MFKDIDRELREDDKRGIMVIAEPGYGKTAVVHQLILRRHTFERLKIIYHLCRDNSRKLCNSAYFILNIIYEMYTHYEQFREVVGNRQIDLSVENSNNITIVCTYDHVYCARVLLLSPLNNMSVPEDKLFIVVDALDKCSGSVGSIDIVMSNLYMQMPSWVKFLLTTRNDSKIIQQYESLYFMHLHASDENHQKDFVKHIHNTFKYITKVFCRRIQV